jgi:hypothetical protein
MCRPNIRSEEREQVKVIKWRVGRGEVWDKYQKALQGNLEKWLELEGKYSTDELAENLMKCITDAASNTIGVAEQARPKKHRFRWDKELVELTVEQKEAYNKWKLGGDGANKARQELKIISKRKQKKQRQLEREEDLRKSQEIEKLRSSNPREFWKRIKGGSGRQKQLPVLIKNEIGELVQGEEMRKVWKKSFENLLQHKGAILDRQHMQIISEVEKVSEKTEELGGINRPLELEEVSAAIRKVKEGKASGLDGISIEMIKAGGEVMERALWKLFSEVWESERVPIEWGKGVIVPILKAGNLGEKAFEAGSYRGITLLSVVLKVFTSVIHERLSEFCESENILSEEQAGFRKSRSVTDQIFILHELVKGRFPKRTYCCFLDVQKAYDRVWREVWYKLYNKGVKGKMWQVIRSMLRYRVG